MLKVSYKSAVLAAVIASTLVLTACSSGASSETTSSPGADQATKALDKAYAGVKQEVALRPVPVPREEQNVAIISCSETLPSCVAQSNAISAAVTDVGWWPMVIDGEGPYGAGVAVREALSLAATMIILTQGNCSSIAPIVEEAALALVPVISLDGQDDCTPKSLAVVSNWTFERKSGQRLEVVGRLQADYAVGILDGDANALVLTQTGATSTAAIAKGFDQELKALGTGKVAQTLELSAAEIADKTFTAKVVDAVKQTKATVVVVPEDMWVTEGGLGAALLADKETRSVLVIGRGGSAAALDAIRAGNKGLTATVAQAWDWQAFGIVDAALRMYAGDEQIFVGDAIQVVDADHNMPDSGGYAPSDARGRYTSQWVAKTPTPTPSPTTTRRN